MKIIEHLEKEIARKDAEISALKGELSKIRSEIKNKQTLRITKRHTITNHFLTKTAA